MPRFDVQGLEENTVKILDDDSIEILEAPGPSSCNLLIHIPSQHTAIAGLCYQEQTAQCAGMFRQGTLFKALKVWSFYEPCNVRS